MLIKSLVAPRLLTAFWLLATVALVAPASAQYIYIDTNGDGVNTSDDRLNAVGSTPVTIWLDSRSNRDGSPGVCPSLGFVSHEFILHAVGGTVTWGTYAINNGAVWFIFTPTASSSTDFHFSAITHPGPGGVVGEAPGLYRLGTIDVQVASGTPCLVFAGSTPLSPCFSTSFGGGCPGVQFDNTLKLGSDWFDSDGTAPDAVAISGTVTASCPTAGSGLLGVTVDAFEIGSGDLVGSTVTGTGGNYALGPLPGGSYVVTVITPLGYTTATPEVSATISCGQTPTASFALTCLTVVANPRTIGFWKHQVGVALGGNGQPQVDAATLCGYLDLIEDHFNNNALNQVLIYQPPNGATCEQKFETAGVLLNLAGSVAMIDRARQQLMALLLNVAGGKLGQTSVISNDGATVSQAITYCDNLIDAAGNVEKAKTIADIINNGGKVPAGMIPLGTARIAYAPKAERYSLRVNPNPGRGEWTFQFAMATPGSVTLRVYDPAGRSVATIFQGVTGKGPQTVRWDGRTDAGKQAASGLYIAQLLTPEGSEAVKLLKLRF